MSLVASSIAGLAYGFCCMGRITLVLRSAGFRAPRDELLLTGPCLQAYAGLVQGLLPASYAASSQHHLLAAAFTAAADEGTSSRASSLPMSMLSSTLVEWHAQAIHAQCLACYALLPYGEHPPPLADLQR